MDSSVYISTYVVYHEGFESIFSNPIQQDLHPRITSPSCSCFIFRCLQKLLVFRVYSSFKGWSWKINLYWRLWRDTWLYLFVQAGCLHLKINNLHQQFLVMSKQNHLLPQTPNLWLCSRPKHLFYSRWGGAASNSQLKGDCFLPLSPIGLRGIVITGVVRASVNVWFPSISRRTPCPIKSILVVCVGAG